MQTINLRKKTTKVLFAILFFVIVYITLLIAAIILAAFCTYLGYKTIVIMTSSITLLLGIGIIGLGFIVLFFLIKFMFKRSKVDRSMMIEIKQHEEPRLFELISNLSNEIQTNFPRRVYITNDVNAFVFYNSSFWSMFFPVRKNLVIGLGLVNSVTESELKAILAHEFGHFSQKSMAVGSYVYNVNKIIYNLLFDNDSYDEIVSKWGNSITYFTVFTFLGFKIIELIQWILIKVYTVVHLSYMELSREMEFHADGIAASVAGSQPLIDSLLRLEFANICWHQVLDFYEKKISDGIKTDNIYSHHTASMQLLSKKDKVELYNGLPHVKIDDISKFNYSSVVVKDQWASHPSTLDRVQRLTVLGVAVPLSQSSAWNYFSDPETVQRQMTKEVFASVQYKNEPTDLSLEKFKEMYYDQIDTYSFEPEYHNFYDNRDIEPFDLDSIMSASEGNLPAVLKEIFNDSAIKMSHRQAGLKSDIEVLDQILLQKGTISSFDYKGVKYKSKDAKSIIDILKKEKDEVDKSIQDINTIAYLFFYAKANTKNEGYKLKAYYYNYFDKIDEFKSDTQKYNEFLQLCNFIQYTTPVDEIASNMNRVYMKEGDIKARLKCLLENSDIKHVLNDDIREQVKMYISRNYEYFSNASYQYDSNLIDMMYTSINAFFWLSYEELFIQKKKLLTLQISMLKQ